MANLAAATKPSKRFSLTPIRAVTISSITSLSSATDDVEMHAAEMHRKWNRIDSERGADESSDGDLSRPRI